MNALLISDGLKSTKGLGSIFDPSNPIILPPAPTTQQSTSSIFDKINAGVTTVANTVKTVQNTVSSFNPPSSSQPSPTTIALTPTSAPPAAQPSGLSTGAKVGIGLGAAAVLAAIGIAIAKSGKKKSVAGIAGVKKKRAKK